MSLKERLIKDTLVYSGANYIAMAVGIAVSLATKAILGTVGTGYWAMLKVFCSYGEYSDLGVKSALFREVAQATGAGEAAEGERLTNNSFSFMALTALLAATLMVGAAYFVVKHPVLKSGLYLAAALVVATQWYNFMLSLLRTLKKVTFLSGIILLNILLVAFFSIIGAMWRGVQGLVLGLFIATVLAALVAFRGAGVRVRWEWDWKRIGRLLKVGIPMVFLSYALITFLSIDAVMIGKMIGYKELGYYTIGLMCVQQVSTIGRFSQIILLPYVQECYGASREISDTRPYFMRATRILFFLLPLVIGAVVFLVPIVVHALLPQFEPGLAAMKILTLGYFFVASNELSSTVLLTVNKHHTLVPLLFLLVGLAVLLNWLFIRKGWGIEGVALATAITYFIYFLSVFFLGFGKLLSAGELFKMIGTALGSFLYLAGSVWMIGDSFHLENFTVDALLKFCLFLGVCAPFVWWLERKERLFSAMIRIVKRKISFT